MIINMTSKTFVCHSTQGGKKEQTMDCNKF